MDYVKTSVSRASSPFSLLTKFVLFAGSWGERIEAERISLGATRHRVRLGAQRTEPAKPSDSMGALYARGASRSVDTLRTMVPY